MPMVHSHGSELQNIKYCWLHLSASFEGFVMTSPTKQCHTLSVEDILKPNIYLFITVWGCKLAVNLQRGGVVFGRSLFLDPAYDQL